MGLPPTRQNGVVSLSPPATWRPRRPAIDKIRSARPQRLKRQRVITGVATRVGREANQPRAWPFHYNASLVNGRPFELSFSDRCAQCWRDVEAPGAVALRASAVALSAVALALGAMLAPSATAHAQATDPQAASPLEPASSGGLVRVERALERLSQHRRLLLIAAHPDDEDNSLLARVTRGDGGEAAYLSLNRGEGGQNLIGEELGEALGLLRSRELEAAREIDGASQFFTRAYDFGYTRSRAEALRRWDEATLVEDVVRVIRMFRPQVIVSVWPPDARAGHGQHQAAGKVAPEAFAAAGDPRAFPGLDAEGLAPWSCAALYRPAWFEPEAAGVRVAFGRLDPLTGRSMLQLARASRSQHRSQDMGSLQPLGDAEGRYLRLEPPGADPRPGDDPGANDLFAGIDTRLESIAALLAPGPLRSATAERLSRVATLAMQTRATLVPSRLDAAVPPLGDIVRLLKETASALGAAHASSDARHALALVEEKRAIAESALAAAAGIAVDAWSEQASLVPGSHFEVSAMVWNAGRRSMGAPVIEAASPEGLTVTEAVVIDDQARADRRRSAPRPSASYRLEVAVPDDTAPSIPYFLRQARRGDRYRWQTTPTAVRGLPAGPPPLTVRFRLRVDDVPLTLEREVVQRVRDQARGEVRRPLRVVPKLEVGLEPRMLVWRLGTREQATLKVWATNNLAREVEVRIEARTPEGWPQIAPTRVLIPARGRREIPLRLLAPANLERGRYPVEVRLLDDTGRTYRRAIEVIDHPHIAPTARPVPARLTISAGSIALPALTRVAYVRGASDRVPEALSAIGLPIEVQSASALLTAELGRYDAVVIGSRAYETDPSLATLSPALLAYARAGGTVIVQYQQYAFARGHFAPYPLDIHRPHDRATDETTPVRILAPEQPVLRRPNVIVAADWDGWVQERGLYFAGSWDDAYTPILAMADPEGVERSGALLVARVGEGWYVYTGLAFFRQLPAGVVGAYRLMANLLALAAED